MKIAIISDTHDNIPNLEKAIKLFLDNNAVELIHCGDLCAPFMLEEIRTRFPGKIHIVFGNINDRHMIPLKAKELGINFYGDLAEIEINNKKIAVNHFPQIAEGLAESGKYDLVCYGHTHKPDKRKIKNTWILNPGSTLGWRNKPSAAIYDTESDDINILEFE